MNYGHENKFWKWNIYFLSFEIAEFVKSSNKLKKSVKSIKNYVINHKYHIFYFNALTIRFGSEINEG